MSASSIPERDERWGDYNGEGIWYACADCGTLHQTEDDVGFHNLLEHLCAEIGEQSAALYETFEVGDPNGRWATVEDQGLFEFISPDGRKAVCDYGVVSSWNERTHSWMWGWGFPDEWVHEKALKPVNHAYDLALANGWQSVTERLLAVNEHEAWHLTKLVAHLNSMPMVYRARVNDINWHYFAMTRPRWLS